jgi:hypothetical protein
MSEEPTITLPVNILEQDLSIAELGTIMVLMCLPHLTPIVKNVWLKDKTFEAGLLSLDSKGVITIEDNVATINFTNQ